MYPELSSNEIVGKARELHVKKIDQLLGDDDALAKCRAGEVARMTEVSEKWHGVGAEQVQEESEMSKLRTAGYLAALFALAAEAEATEGIVNGEAARTAALLEETAGQGEAGQRHDSEE
jgi:hypothetical protein